MILFTLVIFPAAHGGGIRPVQIPADSELMQSVHIRTAYMECDNLSVSVYIQAVSIGQSRSGQLYKTFYDVNAANVTLAVSEKTVTDYTRMDGKISIETQLWDLGLDRFHNVTVSSQFHNHTVSSTHEIFLADQPQITDGSGCPYRP